jgi:hypothetical protein
VQTQELLYPLLRQQEPMMPNRFLISQNPFPALLQKDIQPLLVARHLRLQLSVGPQFSLGWKMRFEHDK